MNSEKTYNSCFKKLNKSVAPEVWLREKKSENVDNHFSRTGKMVEIGGTMPENLPTEKHIKEVKKEIKQSEKIETKKIKEIG